MIRIKPLPVLVVALAIALVIVSGIAVHSRNSAQVEISELNDAIDFLQGMVSHHERRLGGCQQGCALLSRLAVNYESRSETLEILAALQPDAFTVNKVDLRLRDQYELFIFDEKRYDSDWSERTDYDPSFACVLVEKDTFDIVDLLVDKGTIQSVSFSTFAEESHKQVLHWESPSGQEMEHSIFPTGFVKIENR